VEAVTPLDAQATLVGRTVATVHREDVVVPDVVGHLTTNTTVRANRCYLLHNLYPWSQGLPPALDNAPVGQAATHSPQPTQVLSPMGSSMSNMMCELMPRSAKPMTSLPCTSRQARTHKVHWMQASRLTAMAGCDRSGGRCARCSKRGAPTFICSDQ